MGYDTSYQLYVEPALTQEEFDSLDDLPFEEVDRLRPDLTYLGDAYTTWYEHEDDMKAISLRFPNHEFTLFGVGDSNETDDWIKHFKNGKMQTRIGHVVYPDYKEDAFE